MLCPLDKTAMKQIHAYDAFLDVCPECMGVWFDSAELEKMTEKLTRGISDDSIKGTEKVNKEEKEHFWQEDTLECPKDYSKMFKHDFAGDKKIHIDHCERCGGFWIDGYEIKRLEKSLKPNELEERMGKAILDAMNESEKWKRQVESIPLELYLMTHYPVYFILRIIKHLINTGISRLPDFESKLTK